MSQPITLAPTTATTPSAPASSRRTASGSAAASVGAAATVTVDTIPASPPPEVLGAVATAASAADRLAAAGQALRITPGPSSGRVSVQITDLQGNVLAPATPSTVLSVAAGASL